MGRPWFVGDGEVIYGLPLHEKDLKFLVALLRGCINDVINVFWGEDPIPGYGGGGPGMGDLAMTT